jgi:hypothetical protein
MGWFNPVQNVVIDDSTNNDESFRSRPHFVFLWASRKKHRNRHYTDMHRLFVKGEDESLVGFCPILIKGRNSQSINQLNLKFTAGAHNFSWCATVISGLKPPLPFSAGMYRDNVNPRPFGVDNRLSIHKSGVGSLLLVRQTISNRLHRTASLTGLPPNETSGNESGNNQKPCVEREPSLYLHILFGLFFTAIVIWGGKRSVDRNGHRRLGLAATVIGFFGLFCTLSSFGLGSPLAFWRFRWLLGEDDYCDYQPLHGGEIVPRKYLTSNSYWGTLIHMANVLNTDKQIAVIGALTEGSSIRSIERITGVHPDTIMRLGVKVGQGCAKMLDSSMRNLPCNRLEMDEI